MQKQNHGKQRNKLTGRNQPERVSKISGLLSNISVHATRALAEDALRRWAVRIWRWNPAAETFKVLRGLCSFRPGYHVTVIIFL